MLRIIRIAIVLTPENIYGRMELAHISVWISTWQGLATNMQQISLKRCKGVKIIAVLQLNDEVGYKLKNMKIKDGYR